MRRLAALLLPLALVACGTPPEREYHQAQGAIEAARAAGAAAHAPEELAAAEQALKRYDEAVAQRDYRQALNHALDARERASAAAKKAAADKAASRGAIERTIVVLATQVERGRVTANRATRAQEEAARTLRQVITDTERALQNSRAALERDDLKQAGAVLEGLEPRLAQALAAFDAPAAPAGPRRR
jgi:chromatin segregation and condensation protein Rec8/ScpA/Scc1 (kleisin family)